jgi:hypothetical protein
MTAVAQQRDSHPPDPVTIFEFLSRNEWVTRCGAGRRPSGHSAVIAINEGRPDRLCHRQGSNVMSRSGRPPSCASQWQDLHTVPDRVSSAMLLHYDAVRTSRAGLTIVIPRSSHPRQNPPGHQQDHCDQVAAQQQQRNLHCARHAHAAQIFAAQLCSGTSSSGWITRSRSVVKVVSDIWLLP